MKVLNFSYATLEEIFSLAIGLIPMLGIVCTSVAALAYTQAGTTSGNVTAQIAPQGTSLNAVNKTTTSGANESGTTSGNVTAQIAPQGTSLNAVNKTTTSGANESGTTSGNVTAQIAPQGTSLSANSSKGNLTMKR